MGWEMGWAGKQEKISKSGMGLGNVKVELGGMGLDSYTCAV